MSSLIIKIFEIEKVEPHFNADRLDVLTISGFNVVTQKNKYKVGDKVIHIPIQTILSRELELKLFQEGSKIRLDKRRIKTIKIRGQISQGLVVDPKEFQLDYIISNCTKWQPPESSLPNHMKFHQKKKVRPDLKSFVKYTDMENGKYYDRCLKPGMEIVITTKLHGTSARYGWHKFEANTWWQKILSIFKLNPEWVFAYGTRNVQMQARLSKKNYYEGNVYAKMIRQYDLKELPKGFSVYGEIVGDGIQKGWKYGLGKDQHKFYVYDVRDNVAGRWLDHNEMFQFCRDNKLQRVPLQYVGPYEDGLISKFIEVNQLSNEINEGVVVKQTKETTGPMGRFILKFINDKYYLKNEEIEGTDFQ